MTATFPLVLQHDLRGAALAARDLARTGVEFAARGDGVLALRGESVEVIPVGPRRRIVALLDVRGPRAAVPHALDAVIGRLRETASVTPHLGALLSAANADLREFPGVLARVLLLAADPERHALRMASAGAVGPAVAGRSGDVVELGERGPALGLVPDVRWHESGPFRLAAGHVLAACTEGVVESARDDGRVFGADGFRRVLRERRAEGPRAVVRAVLRGSRDFGGDSSRPRTVLALRMCSDAGAN